MTSELAHLETASERRRFTIGCVRAILFTRPGPGEPGRRPMTAVTAAAMGCLAAVGSALFRYPELRSGAAVWFATVAFLGALAVYFVGSTAVIARLTGSSRRLVGLGLADGSVLAALWLLVGEAASWPPARGLWPVVLIPLASLSVGAAGAWLSRTAAGGLQVAVLAALVGGLLLFLVWVGVAVLTGGRPYDPGLVRDFRSSGASDLATYAVDDSLGTGMMLFLLVPALAVLFGGVGSYLAVRLRRTP